MVITYGTDVMIIGGKTYQYIHENDYSADYESRAIESLSLIDTRNWYERDNEPTIEADDDPTSDEPTIMSDLTNMKLPNAMFFNGISIILDDTSNCQVTQEGMKINYKLYKMID